jgi:hypothetical protein
MGVGVLVVSLRQRCVTAGRKSRKFRSFSQENGHEKNQQAAEAVRSVA